MTGHRAAAAPDASADLDPVEALAEEFLARRRAGERPTVEEYAARHPDLAERIRAFFPALGLVEDLKPATLDHTGSLGGAAVPGRGGPLERLGDYRILREVGRGGMGVVYEAEQESLGRRVALKVLAASTLLDPKQLLRFHREAKAAARLHHTNIVPVFGVGEHDGLHYYVMQFIPGRGLDEVLEEVRRLRPTDPNFSLVSPAGERSESAAPTADSPRSPAGETGLISQPGSRYVREVARLGVQAAEALEYAHAQGVLHRDVKPSNLLLDRHGAVWITDFGLAKATDSADLTHTGDIVGTVRYMAPERFQGHCDARSDVYALGLTLYELLAQRPAFAAADRHSLMEQVTRTTPARLRRLVPGVPRDLETIVHKAIEHDPAHRYATAGELAADLRRFLEDRPVAARPIGPVERLIRWGRRNPVVAGLTAAVFVLLATVAVGSVVMAAQIEQKADVAQAKAVAAGQARDAAEKAKDELAKAYAALQATEDRLRRTLYASQMNLAKHAWDAGGFERVQDLLEQHRPKQGEADLRNFEWHYLSRLYHSAGRLTQKGPGLKGHTGFIRNVVFSPDGNRLASASQDRSVKVWNAQTGQELLTLQGLDRMVFSPDGKRLAGGSGREVKVWDAQTGQETLALKEHVGGVQGMAFSPNGKLLATSDARTVKVWDAQTGQELLTLPGNPNTRSAYSLVFSPDSQRLADASGREVKVWDLQTRQAITIDGRSTPVNSVAFSPDGRRLVTTCSWPDRTVAVWDTRTGDKLRTLEGTFGLVFNAVFSPDGRHLASTSRDGTVRVWDAQTGEWLRTLRGRDLPDGMALSPDGRQVASSYGPEIVVREVDAWEGRTIQEGLTLGGPTESQILRVVFSPDGKRLASVAGGDPDGGVKVWDAQTGQKLWAGEHAGGGNSVAISPDGKRLVSSSANGTVKVWDAQTGDPLPAPRRTFGAVKGVAFSPDGRCLAVLSLREVKVQDAQTGEELLTCKAPQGSPVLDIRLGNVVFSPDGKRLASVLGGEAKLWDAQTGEEMFSFPGHTGPVFSVAFSPDGKRLASASTADTEVKVWDTQTGQLVLTLQGHTNGVRCVAFSPDGLRLASVGGGEVKLWDAQTGQETFTFKGHTGGINVLAFSPDGHRLASGANYSTVTIWDATPLPAKP